MEARAYLATITRVYTDLGLDPKLAGGASSESIGHLLGSVPWNEDPEALNPLVDVWKIADGSAQSYHPIFVRPGFSTGYDLLSIREALEQRDRMRGRAPNYDGYVDPHPRDKRIKSGWWQPRWLPFGAFGGSTLLLILDLSPGDEGQMGQVIAYTHDPDEITWVAPSFADFLNASADEFEADPEEVLEGLLHEMD